MATFQADKLFDAAAGGAGKGSLREPPSAEDIFEAARYLGIDPVGEPRCKSGEIGWERRGGEKRRRQGKTRTSPDSLPPSLLVLWIAEEMLTAALPEGFTEHTDGEGVSIE